MWIRVPLRGPGTLADSLCPASSAVGAWYMGGQCGFLCPLRRPRVPSPAPRVPCLRGHRVRGGCMGGRRGFLADRLCPTWGPWVALCGSLWLLVALRVTQVREGSRSSCNCRVNELANVLDCVLASARRLTAECGAAGWRALHGYGPGVRFTSGWCGTRCLF